MNWVDRLGRILSSEGVAQIMLPHRPFLRAWRRFRSPPPLADAKSILVVRFDEIGDLVLTSAFLRELRRNAPRAKITLAVQRLCRELAESCPHVDAVVVREADGPSPGAAARPRQRWSILRQNLRHLFSRRYDLILLPRPGPDYGGAAFFAATAGLGYLVGLRDEAVPAHRGERFDRGWFDRRLTLTRVGHESEGGLQLLEFLGGAVASRQPEAWIGAEDREWAENFLQGRVEAGRPLLIMHPSGGRSRLKQWPRRRFEELANAVTAETGAPWLIVGGEGEPSLPSGGRRIDAVGQIPLRRLAAVMARADLFVGGDSGPAHLAAATGIPTVVLFGSTSQVRFRPRGRRVSVVSLELPCSPDRSGSFIDRCRICVYANPRCLDDLPVAAVAAACRESLRAPRA